MTKQQFLYACQKCGYIKKEIAEKYVEDKHDFTDTDFEACAKESIGNHPSHTMRFNNFQGTLSTKKFIFKGSDRQ